MVENLRLGDDSTVVHQEIAQQLVLGGRQRERDAALGDTMCRLIHLDVTNTQHFVFVYVSIST